MSQEVDKGWGCIMFAVGIALVILSIGGCEYLESLANKNNAVAHNVYQKVEK